MSSNQKGNKPTGVWADWFDEMAQKTVIKKLVKKLPMGEEIANVVEADDKPIEAEIVKNNSNQAVDLNAMIKNNPAQNEESDLLADVEVEEAHDAATGEVLPVDPRKGKPDILANVNPDGTDIYVDEG